MKTKLKYWKFLRTGLESDKGNQTWKIGEWKHQDGEMSLCNNGFHCSKEINQAFSYVSGEILAQVEVKGVSVAEETKEVWSDMRIVKAWNWSKKDSVELAIFSAELVIDIYEKKYPNDDRPRKAIEAAKKYGMKIVGFTSLKGEKMINLVDFSIVAKIHDTPLAQAYHEIAYHLIWLKVLEGFGIKYKGYSENL